MLNFVIIPSSTVVISSISDIANPWFQEYLPFAYIAIGVLLASLLSIWFISLFAKAFHKFTDNNIHTRMGTYEEKKYPWHGRWNEPD